MYKTRITLNDKDGRPITDAAQARKIILDYVAENHPKKKPENVHITKLDDNGNWAATI